MIQAQLKEAVLRTLAYGDIFHYPLTIEEVLRYLIETPASAAAIEATLCELVTTDEITDPHDLRIVTQVNGETMQDGLTQDMVFKIPYLVAYLSRTFTLLPGDLILTGTPSGVGKGMTPPRFLQNGDEVSVTIDGIGTITNPCEVLT